MDFSQLLAHNQFASGGLLLMATGAVMAVLRNVPLQFYNWVMGRLFINLTVMANDDAFEWVEIWLAEMKYSRDRARDLKVRTKKLGRRTGEMPTIFFTPSPGTHWVFWNNRFLSIYRGKEEATLGPGGGGGGGSFQRPAVATGMSTPKEYYCISIMTRDRSLMQKMMSEAHEVAHPATERKIYIRQSKWGDWSRDMERRPRPLESVILPEGVMEGLLSDVRTFISKELWYHNMGIPHRRGWLLYGPPGNGKSSIVMAIASELKMDICIISLNGVSMDDSALQSCLAEVPPESIVLLEDIDCVFQERKKTEDTSGTVSFSGLLNAIDGVVASEGRLLFMTTNHIEKLDPALIRPGRCDVRLLVDNANRDQAERLFLRFFPGEHELAVQFSESAEGNSVASLQGHLLQNCTDPIAACREMSQKALTKCATSASVV